MKGIKTTVLVYNYSETGAYLNISVKCQHLTFLQDVCLYGVNRISIPSCSSEFSVSFFSE